MIVSTSISSITRVLTLLRNNYLSMTVNDSFCRNCLSQTFQRQIFYFASCYFLSCQKRNYGFRLFPVREDQAVAGPRRGADAAGVHELHAHRAIPERLMRVAEEDHVRV